MRHVRQLAKIDLNLLLIFRLLDETRHVTQAAKILGVSQPTFSHALNRLRSAFDDSLFVKSSQGMVLTPVAESLAKPIRRILEQMEHELIERGAFDLAKMQRCFRVMSTDFIESLILPSIMQQLGAQAPGARVSMLSTGFGLPKAELESGSVDLAIAGFFGDLPEGFYQQSLLTDSFVCVVRKDHPRFKGKKSLSLGDYCRERHLLIAPGGELSGMVDKVLQRQKQARMVVAGSSGFMGAGFVVAQTDAILTAPSRLIAQFKPYLPLLSFEPPLTIPSIKIVQVWHERNHQDPGHRWFRELVRRTLA